MNANVSANDGSERLREHNMVTSPAVEIFCNDCGGRAPQALSFRKARLNRLAVVRLANKIRGTVNITGGTRKSTLAANYHFATANSAIVFTGKRGNLAGMNISDLRWVSLPVVQAFAVAQDQVWAKRRAYAAIFRWQRGQGRARQ